MPATIRSRDRNHDDRNDSDDRHYHDHKADDQENEELRLTNSKDGERRHGMYPLTDNHVDSL